MFTKLERLRDLRLSWNPIRKFIMSSENSEYIYMKLTFLELQGIPIYHADFGQLKQFRSLKYIDMSYSK